MCNLAKNKVYSANYKGRKNYVNNLTVVKSLTIEEKTEFLEKIVLQQEKEKAYVLKCGCRIEPYKSTTNQETGLKLIKVDDEKEEIYMTLNSTRDFYDFCSYAAKGNSGIFSDGKFGNIADVEKDGIEKFVEFNRGKALEYIKKQIFEKLKVYESGYAESHCLKNDLKPGQFNFLPILQAHGKDERGIECLPASLIHIFKSIGLINPLLSREEIEFRYTTIWDESAAKNSDDREKLDKLFNFDPQKQKRTNGYKNPETNFDEIEGKGKIYTFDGVKFDKSESLALRGFSEYYSQIRNTKLPTLVKRFQQTDWSKLFGMDEFNFKTIDFESRGMNKWVGDASDVANEVRDILKNGWCVSLHDRRHHFDGPSGGMDTSRTTHFYAIRSSENSGLAGDDWKNGFIQWIDSYYDNPKDASKCIGYIAKIKYAELHPKCELSGFSVYI